MRRVRFESALRQDRRQRGYGPSKRLCLPVICIDARHAKAVLKMQINKSNRNDAAGIARIMQTGWFVLKLSIATRLGRFWQAGHCWSRSSAILRTRFAASSRILISSSAVPKFKHSRASIHGVQSLSKTVPWTRCFTRKIMCAGAEGGRHYGPRKLAAEPWPRTV